MADIGFNNPELPEIYPIYQIFGLLLKIIQQQMQSIFSFIFYLFKKFYMATHLVRHISKNNNENTRKTRKARCQVQLYPSSYTISQALQSHGGRGARCRWFSGNLSGQGPEKDIPRGRSHYRKAWLFYQKAIFEEGTCSVPTLSDLVEWANTLRERQSLK